METEIMEPSFHEINLDNYFHDEKTINQVLDLFDEIIYVANYAKKYMRYDISNLCFAILSELVYDYDLMDYGVESYLETECNFDVHEDYYSLAVWSHNNKSINIPVPLMTNQHVCSFMKKCKIIQRNTHNRELFYPNEHIQSNLHTNILNILIAASYISENILSYSRNEYFLNIYLQNASDSKKLLNELYEERYNIESSTFCNICKSQQIKMVYIDINNKYIRCKECGSIYNLNSNTKLNTYNISEIYKRYKNGEIIVNLSKEINIDRKTLSNHLNIYKKYLNFYE